MAKKKKSGSKQKKNGASASGANTEEATKANVKAESEVEAGHVQTSNESHTQETAQESAANGKPSQPVLSDDGDAKQLAEAEKDAGNAALKKGELQKAIDHYTKAFELNPSHVYLSNRSAAHLSLGNLEAAKKDAQACVEANPEWAKGYSRLGTALHYLKDFKGATQAYASGLVKDPSNSALLQGLSAAQKSLTDDDVAAAAGNPSDSTGKSTPTPTPTPTPTTGMQEVSSPVDASASASTSTSASTTASSKSDASTISKKDDSRPHQEDNAQGSVVIGIDLGTTYSCVGVWRDGNVEIIPDEEGRRTTPSIVAFTEEGTRLVGYSARSQASRNSRNTVYDVKRLLGQRVTDTQVARDIKRFPFEVIKGKDDAPLIRIQEKQQYQQLKPEQISGLVLGKMKTIAENYLGYPVSKAVVTVPAYFSDAQRQATKNAGAIAGLEVLRIINEPTAAALAYGLDLKAGNKAAHEEARNILVFDLGGGTFDVSILQIEGGIFEVLATGGDTHLGGEDFDGAVEDHLLEEAITKLLGGQGNKGLRKEKREELKQDLRAMKRLRVAAEQAKRELSTGSTASIMLDGFLGKEKQDFHVKLTRAKFEKINEEPFNRCMKTVKRVMQDAKLQTKAIDDVVLVGGSTRIPAIQEMLSKYFGAKDLCKSINPDEAVAYGAAVQGAILGGVRHSAMQQLLLVDVTPLSLGIELTGRVFSTVIPRNTQLPVSRAKTYTTEEDNQTGIDVLVFEGERSSTDSNNLLGQFEITGIQRAPRGVPQIEVRFTVDTNGILNVEALDKVTQARAQTTISAGSGRLSQEEIDRMVRDAQLHEEEDRIRLEQAGDLY